MRQFTPQLIAVLVLGLVSPVIGASVPAEQVASKAVNNLRSGDSAISLSHPRHEATWTRSGVRFAARRGPSWEWSLGSVRIGNASVDLSRDVAPSADRDRLRVDYDRGALIERYLCGSKSVEQQFVIPRRLSSEAGDLVIEGNVRSSGTFAAANAGWVWSDGRGVVSLGQVTVFDRNGVSVPALMDVTAEHVRLTIDGVSLVRAAYPVTVDPEIGTNDFRISFIGTDGSTASRSYDTAVAYNSVNDEFLVVWSQGPTSDTDIYGQRINAATGALIGSSFRISDMGPDPSTLYNASGPAVAYNSTNNEYLVLWAGDDNTPPLVDNENEIFGQRINAATGTELGTNDFRISNMGPDGSTASSAFYPKAAWNSTNNEYLVVWLGYDAGDAEVFGQRLTASDGLEVGPQLALSDTGGAGVTTRQVNGAFGIAYNAANNEYLVVWPADGTATNDEAEVFGQRVSATGTQPGANDFRISSMGPDGNTSYYAYGPVVAWNSIANEYLVVWTGIDNTFPLVLGEEETFGQRLSGVTAAAAGTRIRISSAGTDGDALRDAQNPHVSYSAAINEYFVVWNADAGSTDDEKEVWGQRVSSSGAELGGDVRLSDMGPDTSTLYAPYSQQVAHTSAGTALIVWSSDDNSGALVNDEYEIFGQFFGGLPSGATTTITANPTSIAANGSSTSTITVQAKDGGGLNINIGGASVSLMTTLGSLGSVTDNGNGTYTATLTSTVSTGTATISGTINGSPITDTATVTFVFGPPTNLSATALNTSQVSLTWNTVTGATGYDIYRASVYPSFSFLVSTVNPSHTDSNGLVANQTYVYIVQATRVSGNSAVSTPDATTMIVFTDPTLNSSITVKATHITQLRTAVTAMRVAANLTGYGFSDFTVTAGTTIVKAVHIAELRTALDAARTAIGVSAITYTDTTITASGTIVKGVHVTQLRQGTQ